MLDPVGRARTTEVVAAPTIMAFMAHQQSGREANDNDDSSRPYTTSPPAGLINTHLKKTIESRPKVEREMVGLVRYGAGWIYMHVECRTYIQYVGRLALCM